MSSKQRNSISSLPKATMGKRDLSVSSTESRAEADQDFASRLGRPGQSCILPSKMLEVMYGSEIIMPTLESSGIDLRERSGSFRDGSCWTYTYHPSSNSQQIRVVDTLGGTILPMDVGDGDQYEDSHLKGDADLEKELKYFMVGKVHRSRKGCKKAVCSLVKRVITTRRVPKC